MWLSRWPTYQVQIRDQYYPLSVRGPASRIRKASEDLLLEPPSRTRAPPTPMVCSADATHDARGTQTGARDGDNGRSAPGSLPDPDSVPGGPLPRPPTLYGASLRTQPPKFPDVELSKLCFPSKSLACRPPGIERAATLSASGNMSPMRCPGDGY